jgi:hypothetical protein
MDSDKKAGVKDRQTAEIKFVSNIGGYILKD